MKWEISPFIHTVVGALDCSTPRYQTPAVLFMRTFTRFTTTVSGLCFNQTRLGKKYILKFDK